MQIPDKIKIGGITYDIKLVDNLVDKCGEFDLSKLNITIEKASQEAMELTFIHEILHAINNEVKEIEIEFYAQALYQIIKDNPKLFMEGGVTKNASKKN